MNREKFVYVEDKRGRLIGKCRGTVAAFMAQVGKRVARQCFVKDEGVTWVIIKVMTP